MTANEVEAAAVTPMVTDITLELSPFLPFNSAMNFVQASESPKLENKIMALTATCKATHTPISSLVIHLAIRPKVRILTTVDSMFRKKR